MRAAARDLSVSHIRLDKEGGIIEMEATHPGDKQTRRSGPPAPFAGRPGSRHSSSDSRHAGTPEGNPLPLRNNRARSENSDLSPRVARRCSQCRISCTRNQPPLQANGKSLLISSIIPRSVSCTCLDQWPWPIPVSSGYRRKQHRLVRCRRGQSRSCEGTPIHPVLGGRECCCDRSEAQRVNGGLGAP